MKNITCFLLMYILATSSKAEVCESNITISNIPRGVIRNFLNMLFLGRKIIFTGCRKPAFVRDSDVKFMLYTRNNPIKPVFLNTTFPSLVDPNKPTIILVPGWLCSLTNDRMPQLKNAYLQRYDCNLIGMDWSVIAHDYYAVVVCKARRVAEITATFLCNLQSVRYINLSEVHLVGQSQGAHLAGIIGQEVQKQCGCNIGRITGLDPAGPIYNYRPISERLDESDALFVDVIHTNGGVFGYVGSCGSVDFYPYCGSYQPGCTKITSLSSLLNLPLQSFACSHLRSADYMVESILRNKFMGTPCRACSSVCIHNPFFWLHKNIPMGEDCPRNLTYRNYYVRKNYG